MKAKEAADLLIARVPRDAEWSRGEPYGAYGIVGNREVRRALYCVTPTSEVVRYYHEGGYDLLISHHPFVKRGIPQLIFHTALDCGVGGLNDQWRDLLEIKNPQHFDGTLGWYGEVDPISMEGLCAKIERWIDAPIVGQKYSTIPEIKSVVVCSGLGGLVNDLALKTGADCYILGEAMQTAENSGFQSVVEVGHTLSERMGVKVFKEALAPYGVEVDCAPVGVDRFGAEVFRRYRGFNIVEA
jgi:putative NIF3 family GTP cyclohydrolase 1 type 2